MLVHQHGSHRQRFLHGEIDGSCGSLTAGATSLIGLLKQARSKAADRRSAPRLRFFDFRVIHNVLFGTVYLQRVAEYSRRRIASLRLIISDAIVRKVPCPSPARMRLAGPTSRFAPAPFSPHIIFSFVTEPESKSASSRFCDFLNTGCRGHPCRPPRRRLCIPR